MKDLPDNAPTLSVIVTCFNIENYLEQCLESVVGQSLTDIEIIVVDDGSTDSTPRIIDRFASSDDRIVPVLLGENSPGGVATAANVGLDNATGRYVGFVDGDDFCQPVMFERLVAAMDHHGSDLAICQYELFDDSNEQVSEPADVARWAELDRDYYLLDVEERKRFLRFIAVPWRKLYRRDFIEDHNIRFPEVDYFFEDNPFHWYCLLTARSIAVVPEVLCFHRVARVGQTMATVDERLLRMFDHHDTILSWLEERDLDEEYSPTLVSWVVSQAEWIGRKCPKDLRQQLFDTLAAIMISYDAATIERAMMEGRKGQTAQLLVRTLRHDDFAGFNRLLDAPTRPSSLLSKVYCHLRYAGIRQTALLTGRYLARRVRGLWFRRWRRAQSTKDVDNRDVLFAVALLDRRLERLEDELVALRRKLGSGRVDEE